MDEAYWKDRCLAAERALQLARAGLRVTQPRAAVLAYLADLKSSATADTHCIARALNCSSGRAYTLLSLMQEVGWVDRSKGRQGRHGYASGWRLGHMVQVRAPE